MKLVGLSLVFGVIHYDSLLDCKFRDLISQFKHESGLENIYFVDSRYMYFVFEKSDGEIIRINYNESSLENKESYL